MGQFGLLANIQQLVAFKYITRRLAARYVLKNHSLYIVIIYDGPVGYIGHSSIARLIPLLRDQLSNIQYSMANDYSMANESFSLLGINRAIEE